MVKPLDCQACGEGAVEIYAEPLASGTATFLFSYCRVCHVSITGVVGGHISPRWQEAQSELAETVFRQIAGSPITWQEASRFKANLRTDMILPCALGAVLQREIIGE